CHKGFLVKSNRVRDTRGTLYHRDCYDRERARRQSQKTEPVNEELHHAAAQGDVNLIDILISRGVDINGKASGSAFTPLHVAAFGGRVASAERLLENGADCNARDDGGLTPLHIAAHQGENDFVRLLLANGADIRAKSNSNLTPQKYAILGSHYDTAALLEQMGG
ncbi:unnamed protein product, partial [marine sediment metagenome]